MIQTIVRHITLFFAIATMALPTYAQELNCDVEINHSQVEGSQTSVFETLQSAISDYVNTTKWSQAQISPIEKIECKMFFSIKEYDGTTMTGELQVQSSRPVYNSTYTTTLINFKDTKIEFAYQEGEPLIFSETTMESDLTAIINFYVYMILAIDFDSFSLHGGEQFYQRAENIVNMAQSAGSSGWKAFEDTKNRSAVLDAFTSPATMGLRDMLYQYHRKGLDEMVLSPDKGRAQITSSLDALTKVSEVNSMSVGLSMFKDAKMDELVNIYSKSTQEERDRVYELLYAIYPTESTRLDKIKKGTNK